jgi:hypothetical protein
MLEVRVAQLMDGICRLLWNPDVLCRVCKRPPQRPTGASSIQFTLSHPASLRSFVILLSHTPLGFPTDLRTCDYILNVFSHLILVCSIYHSLCPMWIDHIGHIWCRVQFMNRNVIQFSLSSCYFSDATTLLNALFSNILNLCFCLRMWGQVSNLHNNRQYYSLVF